MDIKRWIRHQWDRAAATLVAAGGLVVLLIGLAGVNDARLATQQIPYIASGGLLGLFLLGVAATLWLSADLRDEWRKLDDIHHQLRLARDEGSEPAGGSDRPPPRSGSRRGQNRHGGGTRMKTDWSAS